MDITAHWHWPQWTMAIMILLGVLFHIANHGKPRGNYNSATGIVSALISVFILTCGGFFS